MKNFRYLILINFLFLISCNNNESIIDVDATNIEIAFKLTDSSGVEKKAFRSGENFTMSFSLHNSSTRNLSYTFTPPPVVFEIRQKDSVVLTSMDGLSFAQVILEADIKQGGNYNTFWIVPTLPSSNFTKILSVGNYEAIVKHNAFFNNYQLRETKAIAFEIIK